MGLTDDPEILKTLSNDLEAGNIENVMIFFQYNHELYELIGALVQSESLKVRLGTTVVLEEIKDTRPDEVILALPSLIPLLKDENPVIRGDAAGLIGTVGTKSQIPLLQSLLTDENRQVIELAEDAIEELSGQTVTN